MDVHVPFCGYDPGSKRLWGYLEEGKNSLGSWWFRDIYIFWGRPGGKIYFKSSKNDNTFLRSAKKKRQKYTVPADDAAVMAEFTEYMTFKKLKYGY